LVFKYLKMNSRCAACGEDYASIKPDDIAPWLTVFVTGLIFQPLLLLVEVNFDFPMWPEIAAFLLLASAFAAVLLPISKGFVIAMLWLMARP